MAALTLRTLTRAGDTTKGTPLTNAEVDTNFINLDADLDLKANLAGPTFTGTVVLPSTTSIGTVSNTEIGYLDGVTSAIQTQLGAKAPTVDPTFTGTVTLPSTTSIGTVSNTEIGYLDGVTSAIQTQINGKSPTAGSASITTVGTIATGIWQGTDVGVAYGGTGASSFTANNVLLGNGASAFQVVAPGTSGNVLQSNGTTWVSAVAGASGATLSNDNSTNTTQYVGMSRITSGAWTAAYAASTKLYFNPSTGTLNSTVFNSLSDLRYKENVTQITYSVNTLNALRGVEFDWKDTGKKSSGVIAQELEAVLPWLVDSNEEGTKSVNYAGLTGYLIEAIKELSERIRVLENK